MNKDCARCEKKVYPIEELKCLDKVWHKQCFKCQACSMTLNMRNYKGFNKNPYCEAHIPKAQATTVAETPEFKRIAENTKLQSNVTYHAEFEKAKGKIRQVADDPETLRIKQNSKNISNVAYHGDLQKKAAMEQRRNINDKGDIRENVEVTNIPENNVNVDNRNIRYQAPPLQRDLTNLQQNNINNSPYTARQSSTVIYTSDRGSVSSPVGGSRNVGSIADFDPLNNYYGSLTSQGSNPQQNHQNPQLRSSGRVYRAMYDYEAQDNDEVSFLHGDLIVDCVAVDSGWMTGCVERSGKVGMLPANYLGPPL